MAVTHQRGARHARWLQLNVGLTRRDGEVLPSARTLFGRLTPLLARYRRQRLLRRFLFLRKPPDVRLRFLGPDPTTDLLPALSRVLDELRRDGVVRRFFPSVYEPETRRFGGPEAMEHVHAYFDADSAAWIALDRLAQRGRRTIPSARLGVAVMSDLFLRTLGDPAEVWDAWFNLSDVVHAPAWDGAVLEIELVQSLRAGALPDEERIVRRYGRANTALAAGLNRAWSRGQLHCGIRAILPFVALVHFNRHGLGERQLPLVAGMVAAWNPTRGLIGADVDEPPAGLVASASARATAGTRAVRAIPT